MNDTEPTAPPGNGERPEVPPIASRKKQREMERKADCEARAAEMLRRFNADLEELGCVWVYEEVRQNGQVAKIQIAFVGQ